jgi:hypothetical protein
MLRKFVYLNNDESYFLFYVPKVMANTDILIPSITSLFQELLHKINVPH